MKYGSFIPLSENDVVEYLKNKGNSDLSGRSAGDTNATARTHCCVRLCRLSLGIYS